ncbi:hypothetical protein GCM10010909_26980 [Acidocella aquatica]|uniref:NRDE family protein n=1 Tax=Acidocella aquatica TaxID=1922313 RepID=A0ABQ6ABP3_9PROT|nr:NRDE family protein [Acidocella aquatica]GLR68017.1 hypothetical protein GCM10010909_26980 [Acidocella aquatica]
MCSIILRIDAQGVFIGANRDEMVERAWEPPGEFWPGVIAGRDRLAGGTWLGMNRHGVVAAVLNRTGTLGPAAGKRSRGELPVMALGEASASAAAQVLAGLDAGAYRPFNLVVADAAGAFLLRGLGEGKPDVARLGEGVTMITSGEPNDVAHPRIARHLPRFSAAAFEDWAALLADAAGDWETTLNIPEKDGFGTVCSSLIALPCPPGKPEWWFAAGRPDAVGFVAVAV